MARANGPVWVGADVVTSTVATMQVTMTIQDNGGFFTPGDVLNMLAAFVDSQNGLLYYKGRLSATTRQQVSYEPFKRDTRRRSEEGEFCTDQNY